MDAAKAFTSTPLTNISLAYRNGKDAYVADKVAPFVSVEKDTGTIYNYGKDAIRSYNAEKADGGEYNKVDFRVKRSDHYVLNEYGLYAEVTNKDVNNAEAPVDAESDVVELLTENMMVNKERELAAAITTSSITNNATPSTKWDVYATSTPFADIRAGKNTMFTAGGKEANSALIGRNVMSYLLDHPEVIARFPGASIITEDMVKNDFAKLFWLDNIYVGRANYVGDEITSDPDAGTLTQIWGDIFLLFYGEATPTQKSISFAKTYAKRKSHRVERAAGEALGKERITKDLHSVLAVKEEYDQVLVNTDTAYLIHTALS